MGYIKWKVENVEVHTVSPSTLPSIEVSLSGYINNYGAYKSRRIDEIANEIEHKLNKSEYVSYRDYCKADVELTEKVYKTMAMSHYGSNPGCVTVIKDVIFHAPATIVFWMDGTKTVVKCQEDDIFDPEKGLAMAIAKKAMGNKGNYCNEFKKWLPEDKVEDVPMLYPALPELPKDFGKKLAEIIDERIEAVKKKIAAGDT